MADLGGNGKNIVICLDGTGNQFAEHNSNVVKLFRVLVRQPERQVAYYDPGVGTLADPSFKTPIGRRINKVFGLAFGRGLTRNLEEAYAYLMDRYQDGDRVYLFGFSRGAYTARAVAGFVHRCGLLEPGSQNLIPYAVKLFKRADFKTAARFKKTYARPCPIHFLGLFDTVSTLGWVWNPIALPNTTNNRDVAIVRHAVAIDERRAYFRQNLWGDRHQDRQDVKQVWFAGVHSDVGGGYAEEESGLAKIALRWMADEACRHGLVVDQPTYRRFVLGEDKHLTAPSHTGPGHRSLRSGWLIAEVIPKRVWDPEKGRRRWQIPGAKRRSIADGSVLHRSVLDRLREVERYRPPNLPPLDEIPSRFGIEGGGLPSSTAGRR